MRAAHALEGGAAPRPPAPRNLLAAAFLACCLAVLPFLSAAGSAPGEGDALLADVARLYGAAGSIEARFRQEVPLQNLGIVRKASGTVYFQRPRKMRWDYRGRDAQMFLSDGRHFYFRPAGSDRIFRRAIDEKSLGGRIPLLLLFGRGDITAWFRVEAALSRKGGSETALRLVPREGGAPEVRRVDMVVGTRDRIIREVHLYDRTGGANHLYLEGTVFDPSLPPDFFRFRKPPGVRIVEE